MSRKALPPERRRHARVSVAVTEDVADALFLIARRQREPLSVVLNRMFERLVARQKELTVYQKPETPAIH